MPLCNQEHLVEPRYVYAMMLVVFCVALWALYRPCAVLRFYKADCPYCVSFEAEWQKFRAVTELWCIDVDCDTAKGASLMSKYGVTSVPTVLFANRLGMMRSYTGERTALALAAF
jgi:glutaredoxin